MKEISEWLTDVSDPGFVWYIKRLSGNDTQATGSHSAGPYIPKRFLFNIFPDLAREDVLNPDMRLSLAVDSHEDTRTARVIWYNGKFHGKTRDEARMTGFGGRTSPLLNPENTGALVIFAFWPSSAGSGASCRVWVCRSVEEEDYAEFLFGTVDPGTWRAWIPSDNEIMPLPGAAATELPPDCWLRPEDIPAEWAARFPTGADIIRKTVEIRPAVGLDPDGRLMVRRNCEYEIFRSVEEMVELPRIKDGFSNLDDFIARAQTILQRRKARSGRSLELHMREILMEEKLEEGIAFSHQPESEPGKKPDFLFPSEQAYKNPDFAPDRLRMLAVKTTCKDRWRQIISEADRIPVKHLLTLQEGISENQFREMVSQNVQLVVPENIIRAYPRSVQPHLVTVDGFIREVQALGCV